MKCREVGGRFTRRTEIDLERPDGSLSTLLENHWSMETDPLKMAAEAAAWLRSRRLPEFLFHEQFTESPFEVGSRAA